MKCEYCGEPAKYGLQAVSANETIVQSKVDRICIVPDKYRVFIHTLDEGEPYPEYTLDDPFPERDSPN